MPDAFLASGPAGAVRITSSAAAGAVSPGAPPSAGPGIAGSAPSTVPPGAPLVAVPPGAFPVVASATFPPAPRASGFFPRQGQRLLDDVRLRQAVFLQQFFGCAGSAEGVGDGDETHRHGVLPRRGR